jgi:hypothetical protein
MTPRDRCKCSRVTAYAQWMSDSAEGTAFTTGRLRLRRFARLPGRVRDAGPGAGWRLRTGGRECMPRPRFLRVTRSSSACDGQIDEAVRWLLFHHNNMVCERITMNDLYGTVGPTAFDATRATFLAKLSGRNRNTATVRATSPSSRRSCRRQTLPSRHQATSSVPVSATI